MGQEVIPLIKTTSNPTSGNTTSNGYPLGQHWFNETSGVEYVHKSNGVWVEVGSGSAYIHPTGDGNLHVPATSTTNSGKVLTAGATAGSLLWSNIVSQDNSITNLKLAQVPTQTIKGRASSGTGDVEDLTAAQALALIGAKSSTYQGEFKTAIVTMGTGAQSYQLPKSTISYFDAPIPTNATMLFKIDASNTANPAQVLTNELFQSVVYIQTGTDITGVSFTYPNGQMIFGTFIMQSSTTYKFTWDAIRVNDTTVKIYLTITKV